MKYVPLIELKKRLSYWTEQAAMGVRLQITRYNKPFVMLVPAHPRGLQVGTKAGSYKFVKVTNDPTQGRWLDVLEQDRNEA